MSNEITMAPDQQAPAQQLPPPYFISKTGANDYQATIDICRVTINDPEFASVFLWLSTLTDQDTVRISFTDSSLRKISFEGHLALLNAIMITSANTIAIIDRMFLGVDCYFIMACKDIEITSFGMLGIPSIYPDKADRLSEKDEAIVAAANALLAHAEEDLHLLTKEEVDSLLDKRTVYIQPEILQQRAK